MFFNGFRVCRFEDGCEKFNHSVPLWSVCIDRARGESTFVDIIQPTLKLSLRGQVTQTPQSLQILTAALMANYPRTPPPVHPCTPPEPERDVQCRVPNSGPWSIATVQQQLYPDVSGRSLLNQRPTATSTLITRVTPTSTNTLLTRNPEASNINLQIYRKHVREDIMLNSMLEKTDDTF